MFAAAMAATPAVKKRPALAIAPDEEELGSTDSATGSDEEEDTETELEEEGEEEEGEGDGGEGMF
jgi:hypothetical protein